MSKTYFVRWTCDRCGRQQETLSTVTSEDRPPVTWEGRCVLPVDDKNEMVGHLLLCGTCTKSLWEWSKADLP